MVHYCEKCKNFIVYTTKGKSIDMDTFRKANIPEPPKFRCSKYIKQLLTSDKKVVPNKRDYNCDFFDSK
jgi:hypothetical protein